MRNGRTRGDCFGHPFDIFAAADKEKGYSQNRESPHFFYLWSNMWSSQTHSKTKSLVNIKFTRLFELALPTRLVGVTGFEPALALPSRIVVSALRHSLSADTPCFVGKNFEKTPHRGVFPSFSLDPEPLARDKQEAVGANQTAANEKEKSASSGHAFLFLVGVTGFEPAASWSRTKRSTELSHTPLSYSIQLFSAPPKESTALRLRSTRSPISSRPHLAASSATGSAASLAYLAEPHPVKLSYYIVLLSLYGKSFVPSYKTP